MNILPLALLSLLSLFTLSIGGDALASNTHLADGQTLVSAGGAFVLGFFSPGSSKKSYLGIWYGNIKVQTVVWVANRQNPIDTSTAANLTLGTQGNLILRNQSGYVFWSTASTNSSSPIAQLLHTGNFVLKDGGVNDTQSFLWQSFDYPADTLLPGMKLGWNRQTGIDSYLTSWKSPDDPSLGEYTYKLDLHGVPEFLIWHNSSPEHRSGLWNGQSFGGIPKWLNQPSSSSVFKFEYVDTQDQIYYMYLVEASNVIARLTLNHSFNQRYVWIQGGWSLYWSLPEVHCDYYAPCGPFGLCNPDDTPMCSCLTRGFQPKSPLKWAVRDNSDGCMRNTVLNCTGDGFMKVRNLMLPDTSNAIADRSIDLEQCRERCLRDCSCTAYSNYHVTDGGTGCIIWMDELTDIKQFPSGGQDLYVRLAESDLATSGSTSSNGRLTVLTVISVALGLLLFGSGGFFVWKKKFGNKVCNPEETDNAETQVQETNLEDELGEGKDPNLLFFDISTISLATNKFSPSNKLGEGGFGAVYKGELETGQMIAVKRLSKYSIQGVAQFKNEVMLIAKLQHVNLVRLLGCCIDGDERMLVYEYMENKSLDTIIFDKTRSAELPWPKRFNIILGIARGLLYLHEDSRLKIIHRDLKSDNILLNKDLNPKISDFGVARIFGDNTDEYTRKVVGTYGYMSPEYAMDGVFSKKSDVFSFGVLVLEIISGKRNRGVYNTESQLNTIGYAWKLWKDGDVLELLDESVTSYKIAEVLRCIQVGLLCVQERPEDRPHMSMVILMLRGSSTSLPQPKQPGYWGDSSLTTDAAETACTINDLTVTVMEGR